MLLTRSTLLTSRQVAKLQTVLADEEHAAVEVTHAVYQALVAAYDEPDPKAARNSMDKVLCSFRTGLPKGLDELAQLGRGLWKRRREILAYFFAGASDGPVEAINGRLEHLRDTALGTNASMHSETGSAS